jgi:hypothetical protein
VTEACSRMRCRSFSQRLINTVTAREIRDIMYLLLISKAIDSDTLFKATGQPELPSTFNKPTPASGKFYAHAQYSLLPHHLSRDYMETSFANKICQSWYVKCQNESGESPGCLG